MFRTPDRSSLPARSARRVARRRVFPVVDPLEARELLTLLGQPLFPSDKVDRDHN